jgi:hypothetical protein
MVRTYLKKTKTYSQGKLVEAVSKCSTGELNPYRASQLYRIPRTTIQNHLQSKSKSFDIGRKPALTRVQEENIVDLLCDLSDWGFGADVDALILIVRNFVREKKLPTPFKNDTPGPDWVYG